MRQAARPLPCVARQPLVAAHAGPEQGAACAQGSAQRLTPPLPAAAAAVAHVSAPPPGPRSKLDALATEYNHLLVTQLESQRTFFEGQLVRQRAEVEAEVGDGRVMSGGRAGG